MQYRVLILGSGGREYAMGLHLQKDKRVEQLFFSPGNGGTSEIGINFDFISHQELLEKIYHEKINWVIIGAENFIADGTSDILKIAGIKVFGPSQSAGRLESSKAYMKDFVTRYGVPTAKYIQTHQLDEALEFLKMLTPPYVIKADGLCAGKGVVITSDFDHASEVLEDFLSGRAFGESGKRVVIEEFIDGFELSVFAICDGEDFVLLPACQDHKRLLDKDNGPNTGGMGAYAPSPLCSNELLEKIRNEIIIPTLEGMKKEKNPFYGVLFAGIMVRELNGVLEPYLLEYNVRFGDPECEVLMPLLKTSLMDICEAVYASNLKSLQVEFEEKSAMAVVLASKSYPYASDNAEKIYFESCGEENAHFVFAGVKRKEESFYASGGRVLLSVGIGDNLRIARDNAYKLIQKVNFNGMQYRKDIGYRAL